MPIGRRGELNRERFGTLDYMATGEWNFLRPEFFRTEESLNLPSNNHKIYEIIFSISMYCYYLLSFIGHLSRELKYKYILILRSIEKEDSP